MINCQSPAYFLSDSHLPLIPSAIDEDWESRVVSFLRTEALKAKTLFLVGDIFDFWFEWKHSVPAGGFRVLAALHELILSGCNIHYLAGNHDGHLGEFLRESVGLEVNRGSIEAEIDGRNFFITHGDGVARGDWGYRVLRALVRWSPTENIYKLIHPDFGIWFANRVSKTSREHLSKEDKFGLIPYRDFAFKKIEQGYNYVIMGHRHHASFLPHGNGGYLSIGEWIISGTYGVFENGELQLKHFSD